MSRSVDLDEKKQGDTRLTVILPTHNRPRHCAAQLRFFKTCGMRQAIVVADSSESQAADAVRAACAGIADYRRFQPNANDKLLSTVQAVETPLVAITPDDDVTFPHAIEAARDYLIANPAYAVAHGYTLRFGLYGDAVDINSVYGFVPSIEDDDPLMRHYNLMRRYQPYFWAVFQRDVLVSALETAQPFCHTPLFHELMFMSAAGMQGKIAMLPMVYAMRGMESSLTPIQKSHPLFAFLDDAELFFSNYFSYRNALVKFIRQRNLVPAERGFINPVTGAGDAGLGQFIDVAHSTWAGREVNTGVLNYAAQSLLGVQQPPLKGDPVSPGGREIGKGDTVHAGRRGRRYIWRQSVLEAEPRDEINIGVSEVTRVEEQLDTYWLD